jgi:hypothetical protein
MGALLDVSIGVLALSGAFWVRNELVYRYRGELLRRVARCAEDDIAHDRAWDWRYEAFERLSYRRMVLEFWRPLDWFIEDTAFITEGPRC